MRLDVGFSWSVVYGLCVWYFLEGLGGYHEVTYAFTEVSDLNTYIPKERIDVPYPYGNYCFQIYPCQEDLHSKL